MLYIFVEQPINDMVITVPAFFNQAERRAMLRAGEMAGVNVLQLINDNSAGQINILNLFFLYMACSKLLCTIMSTKMSNL